MLQGLVVAPSESQRPGNVHLRRGPERSVPVLLIDCESLLVSFLGFGEPLTSLGSGFSPGQEHENISTIDLGSCPTPG